LWGKVAVKYVGYLADFAIFGALGFRFLVLRFRELQSDSTKDESVALASVYEFAQRNAARLGLTGALLLLIDIAGAIARTAYLKHLGILDALLKADPEDIAQRVVAPLVLIAFVLALKRVRGGWIAAALFGVALALRYVVTLRWRAQVTPLHEVAAALWLGTLFALVVAGLPAILRGPAARDRRWQLVAELVARFSRLALVAAGFAALSGIVASWMHLKYFAALWTTQYGYMLDIKLFVVAIVVALGAWNWRRMTPKLNADESVHQLRRSAIAELVFAAIVLLITGVLVTVPSPKLPVAVTSGTTPSKS
jgi:putative copper export protein